MIFKELIRNLLIFSLLIAAQIGYTNAAQLIDQLPSELQGNWTKCIHYQASKPECLNSEATKIDSPLDKKVHQFTYSKTFIVNSDLQKMALGISLGKIDDVDEIRINNQLIGKTGEFEPFFQSGYRYERLYYIPPIYLKFNQFNTLEIKTFSSVNLPGLNRSSVSIGHYFDRAHKLQKQNYIYVFCIASLLLLSVFQFFYFYMVKRSSETLFLALYLLSLCFVAFTRSQAPLHIGIDLTSTYKAEFFMLNLGLLGLTVFVFRFFELEIRNIYSYGLFVMALPGIINILHPNPIDARLIIEIGYGLLCVLVFFLVGSAIIIAIAKGIKYSYFLATLGALCWSIMCYDAASQASFFLNFAYQFEPFILPLNAVFLGIILTLVTTHKYWQTFIGVTYDNLTGTLLRPAFFQRLSQEIERSQKEKSLLLVAVIRIQELKHIENNYGQTAKDSLLLSVSEIVSRHLHPFDLVCYFDEDEFCIASSVESRIEADKKLKYLHRGLIESQQIVDENTRFFIEAKIGGVIYNQDQHLSVSHIIQDANFALEKAKSLKTKEFLLLNNPTVTA